MRNIRIHTLFACAGTKHGCISCAARATHIRPRRCPREIRSCKYNSARRYLARAVRAYSRTIKNVGRCGRIFTALCIFRCEIPARTLPRCAPYTTVFLGAKISLLLMPKYLIFRTRRQANGVAVRVRVYCNKSNRIFRRNTIPNSHLRSA